MSAYLIGLVKIRDSATYARYVQDFMPVLRQFGGELLAADLAPQKLEGDWPYSRTVILRFADKATLQRWYDSPEYQKIARYRTDSSTADLAIVAGLD